MIKESDLKIMSALRQDARQTLTKISEKTGIPISTIYDRIKTHENGVIKKHTSILDFPKIGYNIRLNVFARANNREKFLEFISRNKNVNSVFRIDGEYDYMIDCIFKDMKQMKSFLEELERAGVENHKVNYIIDEIIRENFMNMEDENGN